MNEDRRVRRTRDRLRAATLQLLQEEPSRLTMSAIAELADVNRSTVHQHYADLDDLVCDALTGRLREIAAELTECPFAEERDRAPRQLTTLIAAIIDAEPLLGRLGPSGHARVERRLVECLTEVLDARFRAGQRPDGFDRVRPDVHAGYVAAGLITLALHRREADTAGRLANQAWRLIRGR